MGKGRKVTVAMGIFALFGCIQLGCEKMGVQKEATASPQAEEKVVAAKQPEVSAPEEKKKARVAKKDKTASRPTDKRAIQQIISELTGGKIGPDNSGDLYSGGLTATYTSPEETLPGEGKFGKLFKFLPIIRWYDPDHYYTPNMNVSGEFKHEECIMCHTVQTPGIVAQWKKSKHASTEKGIVGCDKCHGNNHQQLHMPSWKHCGECHPSRRQDTVAVRLVRIPTHFM